MMTKLAFWFLFVDNILILFFPSTSATMKLYYLSGHPNRPCFVLHFNGVTIMLDCGLDVTTAINFLPLQTVPSKRLSKLINWTAKDLTNDDQLASELKECCGKVFIDSEPEFCPPMTGVIDISEVDVILVSNYHCLLALPYITEFTKFKGIIYATEPTLHIGRLYMEELVSYISQVSKPKKASLWKEFTELLPHPLKDITLDAKSWKRCYNLRSVRSSLSKAEVVTFNESKSIVGALTVVALSSGFCLGSSNWIIKSSHEKSLEQQPMRNSDVVILTALSQTPMSNADSMIGEFCMNTASTLKVGGNVLVPCYPSGVIYDLIECLAGHLDSCGLTHVPLYFISPVADSSLAYANIYSEWLSDSKQSKVYIPEAPFIHSELIKNYRLHHYPNFQGGLQLEMRCPCVVFSGHPLLRFGDAVHFLELWGQSANNTVIFTEPDCPYLDALSPYQPLAMKVFYCPIDTSLNFSKANKLLRDLKPLNVVIPEQYTRPPVIHPLQTELIIDQDQPIISVQKGDVLKLPIKRKFETVDMTQELAQSLKPSEIQSGIGVAMMTAYMLSSDNKHLLLPSTSDGGANAFLRNSQFYGGVNVAEFIQALKQQGISVKVEESQSNTIIIDLVDEETLIQIEPESTHIISNGKEPLRAKLRDLLMENLPRLT